MQPRARYNVPLAKKPKDFGMLRAYCNWNSWWWGFCKEQKCIVYDYLLQKLMKRCLIARNMYKFIEIFTFYFLSKLWQQQAGIETSLTKVPRQYNTWGQPANWRQLAKSNPRQHATNETKQTCTQPNTLLH
jgi:hypothetical protein